MLEKQIRAILQERNLEPKDVYRALKINRINFYKTLKTSNMGNKSLRKILAFLGYEINISLYDKTNTNKRN